MSILGRPGAARGFQAVNFVIKLMKFVLKMMKFVFKPMTGACRGVTGGDFSMEES